MSRIISAPLTRNNGVYSIPRVRMGYDSTQIVDSINDDSVGQKISPSEAGKVFHHNNRYTDIARSDPHYC